MSLNPNYHMTVTVFNCLKAADNGGKEQWFKTVLHNCFFSAVRHVTASSDGIQTLSDTHVARIPGSAKYRSYGQWKALEDKSGAFTLVKGDLVIYGEVDEEIDGTKGRRATDLLLKYAPDAFRIATISDNTRTAFGKHYRVEG